MSKILVIGAGAMGGSILSGILAAELYAPAEITVKEHNEELTAAAAEHFGIRGVVNYADIDAEIVIVAVKPPIVPDILRELKAIEYKGLIVSIAAGVTIDSMEAVLGSGYPLIRVMPNTPVSVREGMVSIAKGTWATDEQAEQVQTIFSTLGIAEIMSEEQLEEMGALSGAGPGYAFVIIDALADAGVRIGLPRNLAIRAAAQTLYGAAKIQLETGEHPAVLRDRVTSPGGTTIAGIHAMEQGGLRAAIMDGVVACYEKATEMDNK